MPTLRGEYTMKAYAAFKNGPMTIDAVSKMLALGIPQVAGAVYGLARKGLIRECGRRGLVKTYERTPEQEVMAGVVRNTSLSHDMAAFVAKVTLLEQRAANAEAENKRLRKALKANVEAYKELDL